MFRSDGPIVGMEAPYMRISAILAALLVVAPFATGHEHADADLSLLRELESIFEIEGGARVTDRQWVVLDVGGPGRRFVVRGWMLEDMAGFVRILEPTGMSRTVRRPGFFEQRGAAGDEDNLAAAVWRSKVGDFAKYCRDLLTPPNGEQVGGDSDTLNAAVSQARLACWALQRGDVEVAQRLSALAQATAKKFGDGRKERIDLVQSTASIVAANQAKFAIECAFSGASRSRLLAIWQAIDKLPATSLTAKTMVRDYRALIAEDGAWNEPEDVDPSTLSEPAQIAYWMHRLRDANVLYELLSVPINRNMGVAEEDPPPSPDERLVALGPAAIPALLEHMDDSRPTRSVCRPRHGAIRLIRYGEYCRHVFTRITGRWLGRGYLTESSPMATGNESDFKAKAEAWWRDFQQFGEVGMLKRAVEAGDDDSPGLATKLVEKEPGVAVDAIAIGMRRAKSDNRLALVQSMRGLDARRALPYLLEELSGPDRHCRIAAATLVTEWKQPLGAVTLLKEWRDLSPMPGSISDLLEAMVASEDPTLLRALRDRWLERPASVRCRIIGLAAGLESENATTVGIVDELLAAALGDGARSWNPWQIPGRRGPRSTTEPTIQDLAAEALADRWARPEMFDLHAGSVRRQRARQRVKNEWLVRNGRTPELIALVAKIEPLDESTVRPLVDAWSRAGSLPERTAAAAKLDVLGLAAVDALRRIARDESVDGPTRAFVANLRQRLAGTLREVCSSPDSLPLPAEIRKLVDGLVGRPLDAERFEETLERTVATWPAGATTLSIALEREENEPGFVLSVSYLPGVRSKEDEMARLRYQESLLVAGHSCHEASGMHPGCGKTPQGWTGLSFCIVEAAKRVLECDSDSQVIGSVVYGDSIEIRRSRSRRW